MGFGFWNLPVTVTMERPEMESEKERGGGGRSERELANHWVSMVDLREILPFSCSSSSSLLKSILPASRSSFLLGKASGFFESFMNSPSPGRNSTPKSQELNANANANAKKSRPTPRRERPRE
jgi:hypothetical protein